MKRLVWTLALLSLSACAILHDPSPKPGTDDPPWGPERDRFARHAKVYDIFDDKAFAVAWYESVPFRLARADRVAAWRAFSPDERNKMISAEQAEAAAQEDFLLAFYTGHQPDNDLDSPRSIWRVALVVGSTEILPTRIELVRADATIRALYPAIGNFDTIYRIRFPAWKGSPLADAPFSLMIAGAPGRIELTWDPRGPDPIKR